MADQDGGQMTSFGSQYIWYHFEDQTQGYLSNVNLFRWP